MASTNPLPDGNDEPKKPLRRVMTDHGNKEQRLLRVDQIKDRQTHFVKTAKAKVKPSKFGKTALVVRRIISKQGMVAGTEIDIKSDHLTSIFRELFADIEGLRLNKTPPVADPELFFYAAQELNLRKAAEKERPEPDQSLIDDIGTALRFVEEDFGERTESLDSLLAQGEITFDLLWAIFRPKEFVLAPKHGLMNQTQALRLINTEHGIHPNNTRYFHVAARLITHDGEDFGWGSLELEINGFTGARKITNLPVYPLSCDPEHDKVRKDLVSRGRLYLSLVDSPTCMEYTYSHAVKEVQMLTPSDTSKLYKFNGEGRVMLDSFAFGSHNPEAMKLMNPLVYAQDQILTRDLTEDQLLVCAYWINGFSFTAKVWGQFALIGCTEVVWNEGAFQKIVIREERRRIIHGLVKAHRQDETAFDDIVQNKGRGLVGLLTGNPGVGKTLTAEAVAEVTHRPLYVVSTGELGVDADRVDKRIEQILDITRRWGCVLLIDEAEVFLATRGHDLNRDNLVSIFLRRLEYVID
ncbi:uncharacterized protein KY384_004157 [Bacidia gigantensis]|uniref:uncharacterized protein n=1 Tax=Bacidia gigantensis TaxID=2732470 RepID=UPI001D03C6E2|nr:uncharacterized protein KY384_004157 [Bacidia gigantensis]KAG8530800.1 hypothetical protein KY384_004157 [Bacidia gigantensis]